MTKLLITLALLTTFAVACLQPLKPLPPIGCSSGNAVLVCDNSCNCSWVWVGC